jgi:multiple sugar transport system ATP-binding protein
MAKVVLKNVRKVYDKGVVAVNDFNLEIEDKEFVVFVGPSGCGKSTTLRMIAGLEEITDGEIYIGDKMVNYMQPKDRDIAMVFQNYALYPHMTVFNNIAFPLKMRKLKKAEINLKVQEAADVLGISDLLKRKPKELSGGQRQRVAIGRAIVRHPALFLMDEPLSNLDAKLRNQMRAEIIELRKKIDTTFVYVTHDQTEAMTLGDRIIIMKDGLIQQVGAPQEVFRHPVNKFVAGFIGTPQINFFEAELFRKKDKYGIKVCGAETAVSNEVNDALLKGEIAEGPVTLGIRPENIMFVQKGARDAITAKIEISEMMGSEFHLHLKTEDGKQAVMRVQSMETENRNLSLQSGEEVNIAFAPEYICLFDNQTELNLI